MDTDNHGVLLFACVLLFTKLVLTMLMSTDIYGVLVIDGYLYSRIYGISAVGLNRHSSHAILSAM